MADKFLNITGLQHYNEKKDKEIKKYIESKVVTAEKIQEMIDNSDDGIKISDDNIYEPLETNETEG